METATKYQTVRNPTAIHRTPCQHSVNRQHSYQEGGGLLTSSYRSGHETIDDVVHWVSANSFIVVGRSVGRVLELLRIILLVAWR